MIDLPVEKEETQLLSGVRVIPPEGWREERKGAAGHQAAHRRPPRLQAAQQPAQLVQWHRQGRWLLRA